MYVVYYFLTNVLTFQKQMIMVDTFIGDINEKIIYKGSLYRIDDYKEEYLDLEEPEDY